MNIHVVLVRPEYASNVGMAARATANMGGQKLILINPQCELDLTARQMAAGAQSQLENCVRYDSWDSFYKNEPDGLRLAMTRRGGRKRKVFNFKERLEFLKSQGSSHGDVYLIFGPEADGLDSDDLAYAHFACHLPVDGEFASLNLAQAVLLGLYVAREQFPSQATKNVIGKQPEAIQPFYFPDELIKEWLTAMGFDVNARRASAYLTLRRLFLQNLPTRHEMQVLEAILQQNIRKLKERDSVGFSFKEVADNFGDIARKDI